MDAYIQLKIATPEGPIMDEAVARVRIPSTEGQITVLPNHTPLVTSLDSGEIIAWQDSEPMPIAVVGGFAEIHRTEIIILADFAEHIGHLTEEQIEAAHARAEELREQQRKTSAQEFEHFAAELERNLAVSRMGSRWQNKKYRKISYRVQ